MLEVLDHQAEAQEVSIEHPLFLFCPGAGRALMRRKGKLQVRKLDHTWPGKYKLMHTLTKLKRNCRRKRPKKASEFSIIQNALSAHNRDHGNDVEFILCSYVGAFLLSVVELTSEKTKNGY